jgi:hypothetical protein
MPMGKFADNIRPYVDAELAAAARDPERGFSHLERAHVLGQASTRERCGSAGWSNSTDGSKT